MTHPTGHASGCCHLRWVHISDLIPQPSSDCSLTKVLSLQTTGSPQETGFLQESCNTAVFLQYSFSITAVFLQYSCRNIAVLREYCGIPAVVLQYCSTAVFLQEYCSIPAVFLQYSCSNAVLKYSCSIPTGILQK